MRYIRFDNSQSNLNKYQRGDVLYLYAISIATATALKFNQFGIALRQSGMTQDTVVNLR